MADSKWLLKLYPDEILCAEVFEATDLWPQILEKETYEHRRQTVTHEEEILLNKLEHIEIIGGNLSTSCLKYLMTSSPKLKKLIIGDEIKLDDNDMSRMLPSYMFKNLEGIRFPNAPRLTLATVELLMECCPKLQSLGQLNGWRFTPDEMMLMRTIIAGTNTDLALSPLGIFQQGN